MAASRTSVALSLLLVAALLSGAQAQTYPPPYPPPPSPYPPPPSPYPPPPSPAGSTALAGFGRFLGPLSTDCTYTAVGSANVTSATVTSGGGVSVYPYSAAITTGTSCKDVFTGLAIPYPVAGDSVANGSFQVSSTATISYAASGYQLASYGYSQLGALGSSRFDGVDIYAILRTGNSSAWSLLYTDLQFITFSQLLVQAYSSANITASVSGSNCSTAAAVQAAVARYFALTASPVWTLTTTSAPAASYVLSRCNASSVTLSNYVTSAVATAWTFYRSMTPALGRTPQALALPLFARYSSLFQASSLSTLTAITNTSQLTAALNSAAIVPDAIGSSLALAGNTPAVSATISVTAVGPLTGTQPVFYPYSNAPAVNSTLAATVTNAQQTQTTTTNPAQYFGFYVVPEGAVDVMLSPDPTNTTTQVKTLAPFGGVVSFANSSSTGTLNVGPVAAIVNATWWAAQIASTGSSTNDLPVPTAVTSADYRSAYYNVLGSATVATIFAKEPSYNLLYRDFPATGYTAAAVYVVDTLLPSIPGLGTYFLMRAVNTSSRFPTRDVSGWFYSRLAPQGSAMYTNSSYISASLLSVYTTLGGTVSSPSPPPPSPYASPSYPPPPSPYPPPPTGRRLHRRALLQSTPLLNQILDQVSTAIASSNALITDQITTVSSAAAAGTAVNMTALLTRLAQVAAVQQSDLASALANIAAKVASGDLTGALAAATQAASDFSGTNLLNKVLAKAINTAAVSAIASGGVNVPPPPGGDDSSDNKKKLAIGLGIGLGLGIPLVVGAIAGVVYCIKARRGQQETAPAAAAAEGVYYGASVAVAASTTQASTAQLAAYYRERVGSSTTAA